MDIRRLIHGALALGALGVAVAYAQNLNYNGAISGIANFGDKWDAPATPAAHLVGSVGVHSLFALEVYTKASTGAWLKIYDAASPPTPGVGTPVKKIAIPAAGTAANLGGNNIVFGWTGFNLNNGIYYVVTADFADSDTTAISANTVVVNTDYR